MTATIVAHRVNPPLVSDETAGREDGPAGRSGSISTGSRLARGPPSFPPPPGERSRCVLGEATQNTATPTCWEPAMTADSTLDRIAALRCWTGPVDIAPLTGGITNRNFLVKTSAGRFVVRLGEDILVHGVMRFNELAAARAAHAAGLSPEIVYSEPGVIVSRYVDGRPLDAEAVRAPENRGRIVELIRHCHTEIPRLLRCPCLIFWPFQVNRSYLGTLADEARRLTDALPRLVAVNDVLERAVGPVTLVFGHNDLLPANILDDGARLWLLDFDYAGFNSPLFDLANLASNNGFSADEENWLLSEYFGGRPDPAIVRGFHAMKCASLLREALWSAVSETHSSIDFDYLAYTRDNLARFEAAYAAFAAREARITR
jgi:thiamine kinase-like enzyme